MILGINDRGARLVTIQKVVKFLPSSNYTLLKELCALLHKVAAKSEKNKMTSQNLSMIFAVSIFRSKENEIKNMMEDSGFLGSLMQTLIDDYEIIFGEKLLARTGEYKSSTPNDSQKQLERKVTAQLGLVLQQTKSGNVKKTLPPTPVKSSSVEKK